MAADTAFIGVNLLQSSVTNWCLMEDILRAAKIHADPEVPARSLTESSVG